MIPPIDAMLRICPARRLRMRQHRLDHRHRAEDVDLELASQVVDRRFFQNALVTIAGIVHQNVDRADRILDLGDGGRDRR